MWFRGRPFVAWNCDEHCRKRLRTELSAQGCEHRCTACGAVYGISLDLLMGVTVVKCLH